MSAAAFPVHATPGPLSDGEPFVLAVPSPDSTIRTVARANARDALRTLLAPALGCALSDVPLQSEPGSAPRLALDTPRIGIAIAHEAGLSLVAALRGGRVGIDLMRIAPVPDFDEVARDYLGPEVRAALAKVDEAARPAAFAFAWTRFEAVLKCHGRQIAEWSPDIARLFPKTQFRSLALQEGYAGHVAWVVE